MWLLVRANAVAEAPDGSATLAASPDSGERDDTWRWSVIRRRDAAGALEVVAETDPAHVVVVAQERPVRAAAAVVLDRAAGEAIVLTVLAGRHLAQHTGGPWRRLLGEGDVLVVEGEQADSVTVTGVSSGRLSVVRLSATSRLPLRWSP